MGFETAWFYVKVLSALGAAYTVSKIILFSRKREGAREKISRRGLETAEQRDRMLKQLTASDNGVDQVLITESRNSILKLNIQELLRKLRDGELRPTAVLEAFQAKALEATLARNCVCLFIDEAAEWARRLEALPKEQRGPLYGLPISVKECIHVKGYDQTAGLSRFLFKPAEDDAPIISHLRDLGAIPFCLTNIPQTMKAFGCSNPIYGATGHPMDNERTPGGSTGGEGCLIAMGGSLVGLGTDVGGSLRFPALFCGVAGMKPTTGRIYEGGKRRGGKGLVIGIHSNSGVIARSVDGVRLTMEALLKEPLKMAKLDHRVCPIPWREQLFNPARKLRIGWYVDNGKVSVSPGCARAVTNALELLRGAGHEIVHYSSHRHLLSRAFELYFDHMLADEGVNTMAWLDGDIYDRSIETNVLVWSMPRVVRRTLLKALFWLVSPLSAAHVGRGNYMTRDLQRSIEEVHEVAREMLEEWANLNIDVVITPGFVCPAPYQLDPARLLAAVPITGMYNMLNFPAGVVPMTNYTKQDQEELERSYPNDRKHFDLFYTIVRRAMRQGSEGLPLGVQVVGRPFQEEVVLHAMTLLEQLRESKE